MDDIVVLLAFVWISLLAAGFMHYVFSNFIRHHQAPDTTKRTQDTDHEVRDSKSEEVDVSAKVPSTHVTQERTEIVNGDEKEDTVQRSDNERRILPSPPARRDNVDDESWQQLPEHEAPPPPYSAEQPKDENSYYTDGQNITKEQDTQQISTGVDPQSKNATLLDMPGLGVPTKKKKHESVQELQYAMMPMKLLEVKGGNPRVIKSFEKEPLKFKLDQDGCCVVTPYCVALFPVDCVKEEKTITMRADPHGPYSKVSKEDDSRVYICPHVIFESEQKMEFEANVTLSIAVQYSAKDPDVKIKLHVERINNNVVTDDKLVWHGQDNLVSFEVNKFCKFGIFGEKDEFPKMRRHFLNTVFLSEPSEEIPKCHIIHSYVCGNGFLETHDLLKMIKSQRAKIVVFCQSFEVNYGDNGRAKFYGQDIQVEPDSTVVNFSSRWTSSLFSVDKQFLMSLINSDKSEGHININFKMDVDGSDENIIEESFFSEWKFRFPKTEINATGDGCVGQKIDMRMGDDKLAEISAIVKNFANSMEHMMNQVTPMQTYPISRRAVDRGSLLDLRDDECPTPEMYGPMPQAAAQPSINECLLPRSETTLDSRALPSNQLHALNSNYPASADEQPEIHPPRRSEIPNIHGLANRASDYQFRSEQAHSSHPTEYSDIFGDHSSFSSETKLLPEPLNPDIVNMETQDSNSLIRLFSGEPPNPESKNMEEQKSDPFSTLHGESEEKHRD